MKPVTSTRLSSTSLQHDIRDDATRNIHTAPPPVLRSYWKTLARLTFRQSKPLDLDTCPTSSSSRQFCGTTDKPYSAWFWGQNKETIAVILWSKSPNRSYRFWGPNQETVDLGFEAIPRNPHSSLPCARYRPHTVSPDLSIVRPPSTQPALDHSQSSTSGLLLLPRSSLLPAMPHLSPAILHTNRIMG
jgi:hypothetical protein